MESKSAKKRHHHMIEKLGESLITMPEEIINQLELKNNLKYAISSAKKIISGLINYYFKVFKRLITNCNYH